MKLLACLASCALLALAAAAPTSSDDDKVVVSKAVYIEEFVKYKAEHDIVKVVVPLNSINFDEDDSSSSESNEIDSDILLFFVEADVQPDGSRVDQGLYVLQNGKAKKLLDNGRDAASAGDDSKTAFFGAQDGLYKYDLKTNSAKKYGPITDSIIAIDLEKLGEVIYILTEDREVFKVTGNGENKVKLDDVVKAEQIVVDYENNLFFVNRDREVYVRTDDGVKKVEGLPEKTNTVRAIKPPFVLESGAAAIVDGAVYVVYANGTSEKTNFAFAPTALPTAVAAEAALVQYYAYDKKIYEYNVLALIVSQLVEELDAFLQKQASEIRSIASKQTSLKRKLQPAQ